MKRPNLKIHCVLIMLAIICAGAAAQAQEKCVMQVSAIESSAAKAKVALTGITATATNTVTKQVYRGTPKAGRVDFENIPQGQYNLTVSRPAFKTHIQQHLFACVNAVQGSDVVEVAMIRGNPREIETYKAPAVAGFPSRATITKSPSPSMVGLPLSAAPNAPPIISGGVLNGKAITLPPPEYPEAARAAGVSGEVQVKVLVDETGKVISAGATAGSSPLLQQAAVMAALNASFSPTLLNGVPVRVSGIITYNFAP